jgi:hypothetical protein
MQRFEEVLNLLPPGLVLDGELVVLDDAGRPLFNKLLFGHRRPTYVAFDLLIVDGVDLWPLPRTLSRTYGDGGTRSELTDDLKLARRGANGSKILLRGRPSDRGACFLASSASSSSNSASRIGSVSGSATPP